MKKDILDNTNVSKVLGQIVDYPDQYDPSILVREPRQSNRSLIDIKDDDLPFVGLDTWNCYEVSTLCSNGLPVVGTLKIVYPCTSEFIVESKSIKLYLNSYNMYKCPCDTASETIMFLTEKVAEDLSRLLETTVEAFFHKSLPSTSRPVFDSNQYFTVDNIEKLYLPEFTVYNETPDLIKKVPQEELEYDSNGNMVLCNQYFHSALLKSNCRVTSQPDWGDVYISMRSRDLIDNISLVKYIVSFRDECHFHEEICETIFKRLHDIFEPASLTVTCLYTRRGGIDINPTRSTHEMFLPQDLIDCKIPHCKTLKQ